VAKIITLTMNPAVDIATDVERLEPEHKLRCSAGHHDAGGGGINVARSVTRFNGDVTAVHTCGGATGALLNALLQNENISCRAVPVEGETRIDFAVREMSSGRQFRFVLAGSELAAHEVQRCLEVLRGCVDPGAIVVASGSLPPKVSSDFYAAAAREVAACGARFVLDTSGQPLKRALGSGLYLIKPSRRELAELSNQPLPDRPACVAVCRKVVDAGGAEFVALSLGDDGALFIGRDVALSATAPRVTPISTVGAGDSFLGALVFELARNSSYDEALKTAVAAGSAALLAPGTGLCDVRDVDRLRPQVKISELV